MVKFRFQGLEIWQLAIEVADKLFNIADMLEKRRLYPFAEQLRSAGISTPNVMIEGLRPQLNNKEKAFHPS